MATNGTNGVNGHSHHNQGTFLFTVSPRTSTVDGRDKVHMLMVNFSLSL